MSSVDIARGEISGSKTFDSQVFAPAIANDGTIYLSSYDSGVVAITPSGTTKWVYSDFQNQISSPAVAPDGAIYLGGTHAQLVALNPDGSRRWTFLGEPSSLASIGSPTVALDGSIYVATHDTLYAISSDGSLRWQRDAVADPTLPIALAADGTIYWFSEAGLPCALTPSGNLLWSFSPPQSILRFVCISCSKDNTVYVVTNGETLVDGNLYALRLDGRLKWRVSAPVAAAPVAISDNGTLYQATTFGNGVIALNQDGTKLWQARTSDTSVTALAVVRDGVVFAGTVSGSLFAINPNGSTRWQLNLATNSIGSIAVQADGALVVTAGNTVYFVR